MSKIRDTKQETPQKNIALTSQHTVIPRQTSDPANEFFS